MEGTLHFNEGAEEGGLRFHHNQNYKVHLPDGAVLPVIKSREKLGGSLLCVR